MYNWQLYVQMSSVVLCVYAETIFDSNADPQVSRRCPLSLNFTSIFNQPQIFTILFHKVLTVVP